MGTENAIKTTYKKPVSITTFEGGGTLKDDVLVFVNSDENVDYVARFTTSDNEDVVVVEFGNLRLQLTQEQVDTIQACLNECPANWTSFADAVK